MCPSHRHRWCLLRKVTLLGVLLCLVISCNEGSRVEPLLVGCIPASNAASLQIGVGKNAFSALTSVEKTLIVGGYQGGYHLWGAIRLPNRDDSEIERIHMVACLDNEVVAQALYDGIDGLPHGEETVFGVPIVFLPGVEVWALEDRQVTLVAALQSGVTIYGTSGITRLRCCGHVADGD